jgi:hypothetical protein
VHVGLWSLSVSVFIENVFLRFCDGDVDADDEMGFL